MCLSTAYYETEGDGEKRLLMERVAKFTLADGTVTLEDLLGRTLTVTGTPASVDLMENTILIKG